MALRRLKSFEFVHEAHLEAAMLESNGISAHIKNEAMVNMAPHYSNAVGGVQLFVKEGDFDEALELISGNLNREKELKDLFPDMDSEVPGCPKCGSVNVFQGKSALAGLFIYLLSGLPVSTRKHRYHCASCSNSWKDK